MRALKLDKAMEEQGYTREQRAASLKTLGLRPPTGKTSEEFDREGKAAAAEGGGKFNEQEAKAEAAHQGITGLGTKAGLVRDKDGQWQVGEDGIVPPALVEKAKSLWGLNPFAGTPIQDSAAAARQGLGRSLSGAGMKDEEVAEQEKLIGEDTLTRQQLADRLNAAEKLNESKRPSTLRKGGTGVPKDWQ
jgi:hypothetical protein